MIWKDVDSFPKRIEITRVKYPSQYFQESLLADKGYKFLCQDGEDVIWRHTGLSSIHTVRVKPNGDKVDVKDTTVVGNTYPSGFFLNLWGDFP